MTTEVIRLPTPDWKTPLVQMPGEKNPGAASPYFQRYLQNITVKVQVGETGGIDISGKVDKNTSAGWTAATGTSAKTTFVTYVSPAISDPPTQAQVQAISDHLQVMSQHMKALIDAGLASGLLSN